MADDITFQERLDFYTSKFEDESIICHPIFSVRTYFLSLLGCCCPRFLAVAWFSCCRCRPSHLLATVHSFSSKSRRYSLLCICSSAQQSKWLHLSSALGRKNTRVIICVNILMEFELQDINSIIAINFRANTTIV